MNSIKIGNNIQTLRKSLKMSQAKLADKIGISSQAVSKWEKGESLPETYYLPKIAKILGCSIDDLLNDESLVSKKSKGNIKLNEIVKGIDEINKLKMYLGEDSLFYLGAIKGIDGVMNLDFNFLYENRKNILVIEAIIQALHQGFQIDKNEIENFFNDNFKTYNEIIKYDSLYWENIYINKVNNIKFNN